MSRMPVRRSQLIAPFGPGALMTTPDGVSVICAGLDHWYKREDDLSEDGIDVQEFKINEWRLERLLNVDHFRIPPDFRSNIFGLGDQTNKYLTVPALRFPQWHYCRFCGYMKKYPLTRRGKINDCPICEKKRKKRPNGTGANYCDVRRWAYSRFSMAGVGASLCQPFL